MKRRIRKIAACAVTSLTTISLLAGCGAAGAVDGTKTAATIDGMDIPMGILSLATRYQQGNQELTYNYYSQMYGMSFSPNWDSEDEETGKTNGEEFVENVLDALKILYLSKEKAPDYGVELSDEITSNAAEYAKEFMEANSDETIKLLGVTEDQVKEYLELQAYTKLVQDALYEEAPVEVSDDEANQSSFTYVSISKAVEEENAIEAEEEDTAEEEPAEEDAASEEDAAPEENTDAEEDTEEEPELAPQEKAVQLLALMLGDPEQDMDAAAKSIDETLYASSDHFTTVKAEISVPDSEEDTEDASEETEEEAADEEAPADEESAEEEAPADEESAEEEAPAEEEAVEEEAPAEEETSDEETPAEEETAEEDAADTTEEAAEEEYEVEETDASGYPLALIDALRELSDGEMVPQVIETTDSFYVARLDLAHDEEATEETREQLTDEQQSDYYKTTTDEWVEKCEFSTVDDVIKTLVVSDSNKISLSYDEPEEETEETTEEETEAESETEEAEEESEETTEAETEETTEAETETTTEKETETTTEKAAETTTEKETETTTEKAAETTTEKAE